MSEGPEKRVQAGTSSARPRNSLCIRRPPTRAESNQTVADLFVKILTVADPEILRLLERAEAVIREVILLCGTPQLITSLVDYLMELECAKRYMDSDKAVEPHKLKAKTTRPDMPSEHCRGLGILRQRASMHFSEDLESLDHLIDEMITMSMDGGEPSDPLVRFISEVQMTANMLFLVVSD
eukprot:s391_g7.t1